MLALTGYCGNWNCDKKHLFGAYVLIFTMEELTDDRATKNYNQIEFYVGGLSIDVALERWFNARIDNWNVYIIYGYKFEIFIYASDVFVILSFMDSESRVLV